MRVIVQLEGDHSASWTTKSTPAELATSMTEKNFYLTGEDVPSVMIPKDKIIKVTFEKELGE